MKKSFLALFVILVLSAGALGIWFGFSSVLEDIKDGTPVPEAGATEIEPKTDDEETRAQRQREENQRLYEQHEAEKQARLEQVFSQVDASYLQLEISDNPDYDEFVEIMHQMTHQKVRAEKKEGFIPMHPETIRQVLEALRESENSLNNELIKLAEKWEKGDFKSIIEDHNYLWQIQGGEVGKAYGIESIDSEIEIIKEEFMN